MATAALAPLALRPPSPPPPPSPPLLALVCGAVAGASVLACLDLHDATRLRQAHPALATAVGAAAWSGIAPPRLPLTAAAITRFAAAFPCAACSLQLTPVLPPASASGLAVSRAAAARHEPYARSAFTWAYEVMARESAAGAAALGARLPNVCDVQLHLPPLIHEFDPAVDGGVLAVLQRVVDALPRRTRSLTVTTGNASCPWPPLQLDGSALPSLASLVGNLLLAADAPLPRSLVTLCLTTPSHASTRGGAGPRLGPRIGARLPDLAALPALATLHAAHCPAFDAAALATLPPSLTHLEVTTCGLPRRASFAHLPRLAALSLRGMVLGAYAVARLPPSLQALELMAAAPPHTRSRPAAVAIAAAAADAAAAAAAAAAADAGNVAAAAAAGAAAAIAANAAAAAADADAAAAASAAEDDDANLAFDHLPRLRTLTAVGWVHVGADTLYSLPTSLASLHLALAIRGADALRATREGLAHLTRLTRLTLAASTAHEHDGGMGGEQQWTQGYEEAVAAALMAAPPCVQVLDVSAVVRAYGCGARLTGDAHPALAAALSYSHLHSLRVLDASGSSYYTQGAPWTRDAAASLPPTVAILWLAHCRGLRGRDVSFGHMGGLRALDVSDTDVHFGVVETLPLRLEVLRVCGCSFLFEGAARFVDGSRAAAAFRRLGALRELAATGTEFGSAEVAALPPTMEVLELAHCDLPHVSFGHLPSLRRLLLDASSVADAALASLPPHLEVLRASFCSRIRGSVRGALAAATAAHLTALHDLREVDASGTPPLAAALRGAPPPNLRTLRTDAQAPRSRL